MQFLRLIKQSFFQTLFSALRVKNMNTIERRCCYTHKKFIDNDYQGDGTHQCWISAPYVATFGTEDDPTFYCLFHQHKVKDNEGCLIRPSSVPPKWSTYKTGVILKKLLSAWNTKNKSLSPHERLTFALPGIKCRANCFQDFEFSDSVIFDDSIFENAKFQKSTFCKKASFVNATFTGFFRKADFREAQFQEGADFYGTKFVDVDALFTAARFDGITNFSKVIFDKKADFNEAHFESNAGFEGHPEFKGETSFAAAISPCVRIVVASNI